MEASATTASAPTEARARASTATKGQGVFQTEGGHAAGGCGGPLRCRVGDAGDVGHGAVGVAAVTQGNGIVVLQLVQGLVAALVTPFPVSDREGQRASGAVGPQPGAAA